MRLKSYLIFYHTCRPKSTTDFPGRYPARPGGQGEKRLRNRRKYGIFKNKMGRRKRKSRTGGQPVCFWFRVKGGLS